MTHNIHEIFDLNSQLLLEKQILINNDARYGQAVLFGGGAASGKGFAITNFMRGEMFRVIDVDDLKRLLIKIDTIKKKYPEIRGLDLRKPEDVRTLHDFAYDRNLVDKRNMALLDTFKDPTRLPNIIMDKTLAKKGDIDKVVNILTEAGYTPRNIHLIWVLTNYYIAVERNKTRSRVVPEDIVFATHQGAAKTMTDLLTSQVPNSLDGSVYVILNNTEHTIFWKTPGGENIRPTGKYTDTYSNVYGVDKKTMPDKRSDVPAVVKSFTYLKLKDTGRSLNTNADVQKQLLSWVKQNAPQGLDS